MLSRRRWEGCAGTARYYGGRCGQASGRQLGALRRWQAAQEACAWRRPWRRTLISRSAALAAGSQTAVRTSCRVSVGRCRSSGAAPVVLAASSAVGVIPSVGPATVVAPTSAERVAGQGCVADPRLVDGGPERSRRRGVGRFRSRPELDGDLSIERFPMQPRRAYVIRLRRCPVLVLPPKSGRRQRMTHLTLTS
jgi:hypothetical protein